MQQVTINVEGMSCGHCVHSIEGNVGELKGVEAVKVLLDTGKVDVTFDSNVVSMKEITDVIEDQGYDVKS